MFFHALFGLLPGIAAFLFAPFAFATSLHVSTFLFASLTSALPIDVRPSSMP